MTESEAFEFAIKIFEEEEGRKMQWGSGTLSKDEIAVSCIHMGIVQTLRKFNLLK